MADDAVADCWEDADIDASVAAAPQLRAVLQRKEDERNEHKLRRDMQVSGARDAKNHMMFVACRGYARMRHRHQCYRQWRRRRQLLAVDVSRARLRRPTATDQRRSPASR